MLNPILRVCKTVLSRVTEKRQLRTAQQLNDIPCNSPIRNQGPRAHYVLLWSKPLPDRLGRRHWTHIFSLECHLFMVPALASRMGSYIILHFTLSPDRLRHSLYRRQTLFATPLTRPCKTQQLPY
jgi:hypothetical protein